MDSWKCAERSTKGQMDPNDLKSILTGLEDLQHEIETSFDCEQKSENQSDQNPDKKMPIDVVKNDDSLLSTPPPLVTPHSPAKPQDFIKPNEQKEQFESGRIKTSPVELEKKVPKRESGKNKRHHKEKKVGRERQSGKEKVKGLEFKRLSEDVQHQFELEMKKERLKSEKSRKVQFKKGTQLTAKRNQDTISSPTRDRRSKSIDSDLPLTVAKRAQPVPPSAVKLFVPSERRTRKGTNIKYQMSLARRKDQESETVRLLLSHECIISSNTPIRKIVSALSSQINLDLSPEVEKPTESTDKESVNHEEVVLCEATHDYLGTGRIMPTGDKDLGLFAREKMELIKVCHNGWLRVKLLDSQEIGLVPASYVRRLSTSRIHPKKNETEDWGLFSPEIGWLGDVEGDTAIGKVKKLERVSDLKGVIELRRKKKGTGKGDVTMDSLGVQARIAFPRPEFITLARVFSLRRDMTSAEAIAEITNSLEERAERTELITDMRTNPSNWSLVRVSRESVLDDRDLIAAPYSLQNQRIDFELRRKPYAPPLLLEQKQPKKRKKEKIPQTRPHRSFTMRY